MEGTKRRDTTVLRWMMGGFVAVMLIGFLVHKIFDHDIFFHIRCGLDMLEQGRIIMTNIYSFTSPGYEFSNQSWLSKIIFALVYKAGGINAVSVFSMTILLVSSGYLFLGLRTRRYFFLYWFVLCCGIMLFAMRFLFRPQIFSYVFFIAELVILMTAVRRKRPLLLYALLPVQLLWNQMHAFCVIGAALTLAFLGDYVYEWFVHRQRWRRNSRVLMQHMVVVSVLMGLTFFVMPRPDLFVKMYVQLFTDYRQFCFSYISEFERYHPTLLFWAFFLVTVPICVRFRKPGDRALTVLYGFFFIWTLLAVRNISYFALTAMIITSQAIRERRLSHLPACLMRQIRRWRVGLIIAGTAFVLWMAALNLCLAAQYWGIGISPSSLPVKSAMFINEQQLQGRGFCDFAAGSYLLFARPGEKVFIHNQVEAYDPSVMNDYMRAHTDKTLLGLLLKRYDIAYAILAYRPNVVAMIRWFAHSDKWRLVYCDGVDAIFVRTIPAMERVIATCGITDEGDPVTVDELRRMVMLPSSINRMLPDNAEKATVAMTQAYMFMECGLYRRAERALLECGQAYPGVPECAAYLCQLYGMIDAPEKLSAVADTAERRWPGHKAVRFAHAAALFELDRDAEAIALFDQMIVKDRRTITAALWMTGDRNRLDGKDDNALRYYELCRRYEPKDVGLLKMIGLVCARLGKTEQAVESFRACLALDPGAADVRVALETLKKSNA